MLIQSKTDGFRSGKVTFSNLTLAWFIAFVSTLGALFIGEVMGQMPCVTCWYQRIAMFPIVVILGIGLFRDDESAWVYAMPFALAGGAIALWHSLLYAEILSKQIVPCTPSGPSCAGADQLLFEKFPIPYLSLLAFVLILASLMPSFLERLRS